jgi:alkanesulfonate monooxygenase SsuD/methylene tetrahydromethanopterin reductase-like flavin-dependent oxidoreductase (luciferase family)
VYRDELDLITAAEAMGFDTIWLTEHHFADDGYSPSIIPLAAAIAARTERVRIGFNLLLLPLHNAIRVAEDIATLDVLSGGRIDVGLGQGYARHEFDGYGVDRSERLRRFVEGLDVLHGLWTEDTFSYRGEHYVIDGARLQPKPVQRPTPPLWIGATSLPGVRRAGRRGANLLRPDEPAAAARLRAGPRRSGPRAGGRQGAAVALGPRRRDRGRSLGGSCAPLHHLLEVYARWLAESDDPGNRVSNLTVPPVDELRSSPPVLCRPAFGSREHVAAQLNASMEKVRTTHLAFGLLPGMDPRMTRASIELIATQVAPLLRSASGYSRRSGSRPSQSTAASATRW